MWSVHGLIRDSYHLKSEAAFRDGPGGGTRAFQEGDHGSRPETAEGTKDHLINDPAIPTAYRNAQSGMRQAHSGPSLASRGSLPYDGLKCMLGRRLPLMGAPGGLKNKKCS